MTVEASARAKKSTTVRTPSRRRPPLALRAVRQGLGALSRVSPEGAAFVGERLFLSPRRFPRPEAERAVLAEGRRTLIATRHGALAAWEWGAGPGVRRPSVLLVHGWEGRGGQLGAFVGPLVALDFRVVAFDAPGHGESPGARSSLFHFADAIKRADEALGPFHAIITHSMGGAATLWASKDAPLARRVVLIAPPIDLRDFTRALARVLRLSEDVRGRIHRRLGARFGVALEDVQAELVARRMRVPALIVHDEDDRDVPIACGEAIAAAWPGAELHRTRGLGHQRILRDARTRDLVLRFVAQRTVSVAPVASTV